MTITKYLILFLLAFPPDVSGNSRVGVRSKKAFVPRRVVPQEKLVVPRGGQAGNDVTPLAGKVFSGTYLLHGALLQYAPSKLLDLYGFKETSATTKALCADFGSDNVATGIIAYLSLVKKTTANTAIGSAFLYLFLWTLATLFTGRQGSLGAKNAPIYARLVLFGLGTVSTLFRNDDEDYGDSVASKLAKAVAYFRLVYGVFTVWKPDKVGDTWGLLLKESIADHYMMRALGFSITWISLVMVALLHSSMEAPMAVGYGGIGTVAYMFCQKFITKEWNKVGMTTAQYYIWTIYLAIWTTAVLSLKNDIY